MEKQTFLMEIYDIINKRTAGFDDAIKLLVNVKEAIRATAFAGNKQYNFYKASRYIDVYGINVRISEETHKKVADFLREEGFTVADHNDGYYRITWE